MFANICTAHSDEENARHNVIIAPDTFASFRQFLIEEEQRTGLCLAAQARARRLVLPAFEARATPFALAAVARFFDYDEAVISLIEEAQFCRLCLTVRPLADGGANLALSNTTDAQFVSQLDRSPSAIDAAVATVVPRQRYRPGRSEIRGAEPAPMAVPRIAVAGVYPTDRSISRPPGLAG